MKFHLFLNQASEVIGCSEAALVILDNREVLEAVDGVLKEVHRINIEDFKISTLNLGKGYFELNLCSERFESEPKRGDIVNAGLSIYHSDWGKFPTQISTYLLRVICSNGMLVPICKETNQIRIRRRPDEPRAREALLRNLRKAAELTARQFMLKLEALKALTEIEADTGKLIGLLNGRIKGKVYGSKRLGRLLEAALREDELGYSQTQYAFMNALSRVATHRYQDLSRRRSLMTLAGVFSQRHVHRCEKCDSLLLDEEEV